MKIREHILPGEKADPRPEKSWLVHALAMARAPRRKPTAADAPPPSTFPMTRAAREARRLDKGRD